MASDPEATPNSGSPEPHGEEGRFAATWQNKAAGRALRAARLTLPPEDSKQSSFATALSERLGIPISPTTLSGWETGRRTVPAPVWMAAAMTTNQSLDALVADSAAPEVAAWAESAGLLRRLEGQDAELRGLRKELGEVRRQHGEFYAQVVETLTRAGLALARRQAPQHRDAGDREASAG